MFGKCLLGVGFAVSFLAAICFYSDIYLDMVRVRGDIGPLPVVDSAPSSSPVLPAEGPAGETVTSVAHRF